MGKSKETQLPENLTIIRPHPRHLSCSNTTPEEIWSSLRVGTPSYFSSLTLYSSTMRFITFFFFPHGVSPVLLKTAGDYESYDLHMLLALLLPAAVNVSLIPCSNSLFLNCKSWGKRLYPRCMQAAFTRGEIGVPAVELEFSGLFSKDGGRRGEGCKGAQLAHGLQHGRSSRARTGLVVRRTRCLRRCQAGASFPCCCLLEACLLQVSSAGQCYVSVNMSAAPIDIERRTGRDIHHIGGLLLASLFNLTYDSVP